MINVLEELESFLRYNELSWKDVICLDIYKHNGWERQDNLQLGLKYTPDDLEHFKREAHLIDYIEHSHQKLFGNVWLTENRWIERVFSIYEVSSRWELKQMPEIPFS